MSSFLDEYNALRSELVALYSRRGTIQSVGTGLLAGLLAASVTSRTPELAVLGVYLIIAFWCDDIRGNTGIDRIGSYIRVVLEPRVYGLQWETVLSKFSRPHRHDPSFLERLGFLFGRYPMTAVVGLAAGVWTLTADWNLEQPRVVANGTALGIAFVIFIGAFIWATRCKYIHGEWEKTLETSGEAIAEIIESPLKSQKD